MNKYILSFRDAIHHGVIKNLEQINNKIKHGIQNINIDNISSLAYWICVFNKHDSIVPLLNYLFKSNFDNDIIYNKIEYIYIMSCSSNNIYMLKSLMLYCYKYNYKFDFHCNEDEAFSRACYYGYIDIIKFLITINKKYYYKQWNNFVDLKDEQIDIYCNSLKYIFNVKHLQQQKNCYIFNNNIDNINNFYFEICDKTYTSYILYLKK